MFFNILFDLFFNAFFDIFLDIFFTIFFEIFFNILLDIFFNIFPNILLNIFPNILLNIFLNVFDIFFNIFSYIVFDIVFGASTTISDLLIPVFAFFTVIYFFDILPRVVLHAFNIPDTLLSTLDLFDILHRLFSIFQLSQATIFLNLYFSRLCFIQTNSFRVLRVYSRKILRGCGELMTGASNLFLTV
ncbi:hypothetical protein NpNSSI1_00005162 [Neofusicoccum parvum]|nr:hypothetical protein NpNSSI1_00005162 [Neofusicoccum parvum]